MNRILVTGATGFLGSNLVHRLIGRNRIVRILRRQSSPLINLTGMQVEHAIGDVRDTSSVEMAVEGCDTVYHTAAMVTFWKQKYPEMMEVNVAGTRNVVRACLSHGVRRMIHTSSVAALGCENDGRLIDENTPFNWDRLPGYRYSKHLAELEVLDGISRGLDAVIINPTVIIGAGDLHIHGGQFIRDVKKGRIPAYTGGGTNLVGVDDVVSGMIEAAERGRCGERYILGNVNLTHREVLHTVARVIGGKAPSLKVPAWVARSVARICDLWGDISGHQPWLTSDLLAGLGRLQWYSIEKAKRELRYLPNPIESAIAGAYAWYRHAGVI